MECPYETTSRADCIVCQAEKQMPNDYCCLIECGEHEFCRGCDKGIYLKKELDVYSGYDGTFLNL